MNKQETLTEWQYADTHVMDRPLKKALRFKSLNFIN